MTAGVEGVRQALPAYELGEEIGRGGFGVVWAAVHVQLGRAVAVKQLAPHLAADPEVRRRFRAEARVVAALDHPHIVPVYDYVEHDGLCLLVMERLPGGTAGTRHRSGGLSPEGACAVGLAAAAGLHHAHSEGVLHRDVKPDNLMISAGGVLKVADFGIAKVVGGTESFATRSGSILGTPAYMAPEQARGGELGPQADVYALGVVLYELLGARLPFSEEGGAMAVLYRRVNENPAPLAEVNPALPAEVTEVVMRALATAAEDRHASAAAFASDLAAAAEAAWGSEWLARAELPVVANAPLSDGSRRRGGLAAAASSAAETGAAAPPASTGGWRNSAAWSALRTTGSVPRARAVTLGLALASMAVGASGVGGPPSTRPLVPGAGTLAGGDLAIAGAISVDISRPIELQLHRVPVALSSVTSARLRLSVAGIGLGTSDVARLSVVDREGRASFNASGSRYLAAGRLTASVDFLSDGQVVLTQEVPVRASGVPLLTVPGVLALALVAMVVAYAESLLRPLRRGRRRLASFVGMVMVGAAGGVAVSAFLWLFGLAAPTLPAVTGAGILAGLAGLASAVAAARVGSRRRLAVMLASGTSLAPGAS